MVKTRCIIKVDWKRQKMTIRFQVCKWKWSADPCRTRNSEVDLEFSSIIEEKQGTPTLIAYNKEALQANEQRVWQEKR